MKEITLGRNVRAIDNKENVNSRDKGKENKVQLNEAEDKENTLSNYEEYSKMQSNDYISCYNLGVIHEEKNNIAEAIKLYERSIVIKPDYIWSYHRLGNIHYKLKNFDDALAYYINLNDMLPDQPEILYKIAKIFIKQEKHKEALNFLMKIYNQDEKFATEGKGIIEKIATQNEKIANYNMANFFLAKLLEKSTDKKKYLLRIGENFFKAKKYQKSLDYYLRYIEENDNKADFTLYNKIGQVYMYKNEHVEAEKFFRKSLEKKPEDVNSKLNLAVALQAINKVDEAVEILSKLVEKIELEEKSEKSGQSLSFSKKEKSHCYYTLGICHHKMKNPQKAIESLKKSIIGNLKTNNLSNFMLGQIYFKIEDYEQSLRCYQKILELDPEYKNINYFVAQSNAALGNNETAKIFYKKHLELDPNDKDSYVKLSLLYFKENNMQINEQSAEYLLKLSEIDPSHKHVHNNLCFYFSSVGEHDISIDYGKKSLEIDGFSLPVAQTIAYNFAQKEDYVEAIKYYLYLVERFPDEMTNESYNNLSRCYYLTENYPDCIKFSQHVLQRDPNNYMAHLNIGLCYFDNDSEDDSEYIASKTKALEHFDLAVQCNPDYAWSLYYLGVILLEFQREEEAKKNFHKCLQLNNEIADAFIKLGFLENTKGRKQEALSYYKQAVELEPDNSDIHTQLSFILRDLGKNEEADKHFQISLKLLQQ